MLYHYYEKLISIDLCQSIITKYNNESSLAYATTYNSKIEKNYNDFSFNKRKMNFFEESHSTEFTDLSKTLLELIKTNKINKPLTYTSIQSYTFNKYEPGDFLDWHSDIAEIETGGTITIIIELNDNYLGGDVQFKINDEIITNKKSRGSVCIFDSKIPHRVSKVNYGERFSLNCWPRLKIDSSIKLL